MVWSKIVEEGLFEESNYLLNLKRDCMVGELYRTDGLKHGLRTAYRLLWKLFIYGMYIVY